MDGKTLREHMVIHAMFGDDMAKPIGLIDYGPSGSHLELRRGYMTLDSHPHHRMKGVEASRFRMGDYRILYDFDRAKGIL